MAMQAAEMAAASHEPEASLVRRAVVMVEMTENHAGINTVISLRDMFAAKPAISLAPRMELARADLRACQIYNEAV